jgi:hypothetical protein
MKNNHQQLMHVGFGWIIPTPQYVNSPIHQNREPANVANNPEDNKIIVQTIKISSSNRSQ